MEGIFSCIFNGKKFKINHWNPFLVFLVFHNIVVNLNAVNLNVVVLKIIEKNYVHFH